MTPTHPHPTPPPAADSAWDAALAKAQADLEADTLAHVRALMLRSQLDAADTVAPVAVAGVDTEAARILADRLDGLDDDAHQDAEWSGYVGEDYADSAATIHRLCAALDAARADAAHSRVRFERAGFAMADARTQAEEWQARAERAEAERDALRAALGRVAWFLREADPHWVRVETDDGPEFATLLGLAMTLEAALASAAVAGDGAGTGEALSAFERGGGIRNRGRSVRPRHRDRACRGGAGAGRLSGRG